MEAGRLNKRITFQRATVAAGEGVTTWTDYKTVWAAIEPLSAQQLFLAQQANSNVTGKIRIRFRRDILATMRIKYGERYLKISSIVNTLERNTELIIYYLEWTD